jgi:23S rRNA pseudouridine1911/1915/1917 synthase
MTLHAHAEDEGKRLDVFLHERVPEYSRSRLQEWIKAGRVLVDGAAQKASYVLKGAETIQVEPGELPPLKAEAEDLPLEVLYADDAVIAVNKPAGVVVHAGAGIHSGTLVNRLLYHFRSLSSLGGEFRPGIVHRLDRYTSGVLLVARTDRAHQALATQFASRTVEKIYIALVHGAVRKDRGEITAKITRDPVRRTRMTARLGTGRTAHTEYEILRRWPAFTLLRVRIGTGRTHQIRVHMASIGHPVAGDRLYGAPARVEGMPPLDRYFLHANSISFESPATGQRITVEAPLPVELEAWMAALPENASIPQNL